MTRSVCVTTSLILLLAAPAVAQFIEVPVIGTEAQLATFSGSIAKGLAVVVTDSSADNDCDFSSGTGAVVHWCFADGAGW